MMSVPLNVEMQKKMDFTFREPGEPFSFLWLYNGISYSVVPELRGVRIYWYMRKMIGGQRFNVYVAPAGKLSAELLNNAAAQIEADASPVKPESE